MRYGLVGGVLLALAWMPAAALAGSFNVTPVKLYFADARSSKVLRITNDGTATVPIQVIVKSWRQDAVGEPVYDDTDDLVFFPAILELAPGQQRLIRIGYQGPEAGAAERTYRLFLEEIPGPEAGARGLNMTLRLGVPVFIGPARTVTNAVLGAPALAGGTLTIPVENKGNHHVVIGEIKATGYDAGGVARFTRSGRGWYVLAGMKRAFTLQVPEGGCADSHEIAITADADGRDLAGRLTVDAAGCAPTP